MADIELLIHEKTLLLEQNEQLKTKYKKSLQELMHILKVNKSLKQCLDQNTKQIEGNIQNQINEIKTNHQQQLQTYIKELDEYKRIYNVQVIQRKKNERQLQSILAELSYSKQQCKKLEMRDRQIEERKELKNENIQDPQVECLKRKVANYIQLSRQKIQLEQQAQHYKQKINELTIQLLQQKQKYRSDIFSKQTEILRSKESEYQKLKTIESRYQLLQTQLNNYKNVQKYFQDQANVIFDQDTVYNSIREQITRINQDFNKYQLESSNLLLRKREEDAQRNRKIIDLEKEVKRLKTFQNLTIQKQKQIQVKMYQISNLKQKITSLEHQKLQITQKNHVLEALTITDKHRVNSSVNQRIKQFQTRIKILLQQTTKEPININTSQQIIVLKGYIRQLSDLLKQTKKRQQHLSKKNQNYKQRLVNTQRIYQQKISEYKQKIQNYDTLINKLYLTLEQKFKQKVPEQVQRQFNTAINHYEQKMMLMSEQIIQLRSKNIELQTHRDLHVNNNIHLQANLQNENQTYKDIISQLSIKINQLQIKIQKHQQIEKQLKEKNKIVDELAKEVNTLNKIVNQSIDKENNTDYFVQKYEKDVNGLKEDLKMKEIMINQVTQNYQRRLLKMKEDLEQKQKITINLSKNSIDTASLIEKVNYLQYELNKHKSRVQPTPKPDDFIKGLESKLNAQNQQLLQYKLQIDKLYVQLKTQKTEKKSSVVDQYSHVAQLQQQITDGQIRILNLQNQYHNKQAQYKDEIQNLKYQNRALIEQLNSKHSEMMVYYEQLNKKNQSQQDALKMPEMRSYIAELQQKNQDIIQRFTYQAKQLNTNILTLRTTNLSLRNQLQNKEDTINQLKHQLFNAELRTQKQKSASASMIKSVSGSIFKDNHHEDTNIDKLMTLVVLLSTEVEALRLKNTELQAMYHEDLDKYKEAFKNLQERQMELVSNLELKDVVSKDNDILHLSEQKISYLSPVGKNIGYEPNKTLQKTTKNYGAYVQINNTFPTTLSQQGLKSNSISSIILQQPSQKPLDNTIRSYGAYNQISNNNSPSKIGSNSSIGNLSPLKSRGISIKRIV